MGWDGAGNFTRTNGSQTGSTTWADARDAAVKITAAQHDTHDQDLADGIEACLTKNGESKPTADFLPNVDATYDLGSESKQWVDLWLSGNITAAGNLAVAGTETKTGIISPTALAANTDDYAPTGLSGARIIRLSSDAAYNITGLTGGASGRHLTLINVGAYPLDLTYEDASSSAANRFAVGIQLGGGQSCEVWYDATSSRWRLVGQAPEPLGTIKDFGASALPAGFLACDGSAVSRTTYANLFNVIGTTWGVGDGSTTFNLPDAARNVRVGSGGSSSATLGNAVGDSGGEEDHQLTTAEMPAHTHGLLPMGNTGASYNVAYQIAANSTQALATGSAGSDGSHNNMQPSIVVKVGIRYC